MSEPCQHENFEAVVTVHRVADPDQPMHFMADLSIRCAACRQKFRFIGVDAGLSFEKPRVNVDGTELNMPIEPELVPMLHQRMRYDMPPVIP